MQTVSFLLLLLTFTLTPALESNSPCKDQQVCLNGGTCLPIDNHSFACQCLSNFTGDFCEFNNQCFSSPCRNGGICHPIEDSGFCTCQFGFTGRFCEDKIKGLVKLGDDLLNLDEDIPNLNLSAFQMKMKQAFLMKSVEEDPCFIPGGGKDQGALGLTRCLNGGTCFPLEKNYECQCTKNFTGSVCQFQNACYNSPCKNGGTCKTVEDSGLCTCPLGFGGTFCEKIGKSYGRRKQSFGTLLKNSTKRSTTNNKDINCTCSNRGQCVHINATHYVCHCQEQYSGSECQFRNPCYEFPCKNDARCEIFDNSGICNCPPEYTGTFCEEEIVEHVDVVIESTVESLVHYCSCLNGGTCTFSSAGDCICPQDFTGHLCEFTNHCKISPCLNGARCEAAEDSATCTCRPGFKGIFCGEIDTSRKSLEERVQGVFPFKKKIAWSGAGGAERDGHEGHVEHCDNSNTVCLNGGKCVILDEDSYGCECTIAFTGPQCQYKDVCLKSPCANGGSCAILGNSGVCDCPPEFTGLFCEEEKIETKKKTGVVGDSKDNSGKISEEWHINSVPALEHNHRSKIPLPPYPHHLEMDAKSYYEQGANAKSGHKHISGVGDSYKISANGTVYVRKHKQKKHKDFVRIAPNGTVYVRKHKSHHHHKKTWAADKFKENEEFYVPASNFKDKIVDASIVKVMPNGELFIKMKIPRRSHHHPRHKHKKHSKHAIKTPQL